MKTNDQEIRPESWTMKAALKGKLLVERIVLTKNGL